MKKTPTAAEKKKYVIHRMDGVLKTGAPVPFINYSFAEIPAGRVIIASTERGVAYLAFVDNQKVSLLTLKKHFPNVKLKNALDSMQKKVISALQNGRALKNASFHLKGTDFQIKVWEALLEIPSGTLVEYGTLAKHIRKERAHRAVGSAVGKNPVAILIPCHRVVRAGGALGGYHWGIQRKAALIAQEKGVLQYSGKKMKGSSSPLYP